MTRPYARFVIAILLALALGGLRPHLSFAAATTVSVCPTTEAALSSDISNAGDGGTVVFTCGAAAIIPFTSTITISQSVTLDGSGASGTVTFDGGGTTQLFIVNGGVTLSLKGLTLAHGNVTSSYGGAIQNWGTLSVSSSTFSGNSASLYGGAIANGGTVSITTSTFSGNTASQTAGAIYTQGTLTVDSSTFSNNSAPLGGAIFMYGSAHVSSSTFSGNSATYGGAVRNDGTITITNSTFSGNSASQYGGTISNHSGTVTVGGSIIANSPHGGNCDGTITDTGYNLSNDTSYSSCGFSSADHDLVNTNPQLGPLQYNGGPTETMALVSSSPAIDQIPLASCPSTDQRGNPRPDGSGETACDLGAYESSYLATTTVLASSANPSVAGQQVTYTAAVSPIPDGGTVSFSDGGTAIGGCGSQLVNTSTGQATCQVTYTSVGSHTITATYTGDATYAWSTSRSFTQTVDKASPSLTTTASPSQGTVGATLKDSATLSGGYSPTGTITFKLYQSTSCSGSPVDTETATVSGNGTYSTPKGHTTTSVGSYQWVASYTGDGNNKAVASTCGNEPAPVGAASPTLTTTPSPSSVTLGASSVTLKDGATLSGGYAPTGTITFTLIGPGDTTVDTETASVSGNGTYSAPKGYTLPMSGTVTGTYQWNASYSGDAGNTKASDTKDPKEQVTVSAASPSLTTTGSPGQPAVGATLTDSATLSDGYSPTGTITFTLHQGSCTGQALETETVTVKGNGSYSTPRGYRVLAAGGDAWVASFAGDGNNKGATSSCEPVTVGRATTTTTLTSAVNPSASAQPVTFTAAVTPSPGSGTPTGTIQFSIDGTLFGSAVPLSGGKASSQSISSLAPGSHTITATYSGDGNYLGSSKSLTQTVTPSHLAGSLVASFHPVEGHLFSGAVATFTDSNTVISSSQLVATISWGDGTTSSGSISGSAGHFTVSCSHSYADEGSVSVSVTLQEQTSGHAAGTASGSVSVAESDVLTPASSPLAPATASRVYSGPVASFSDANTANTAGDFRATISWGDGTSSAGTVSGSGGHLVVSGSHTYSLPGQYTVQTTIMEDGAGTAKASASSTLLVTVPASSRGISVSALGSTGCTTVAALGSVTSSGSPTGTFSLRDERPGGSPCGPYRPGVISLQGVAIDAVVCTSHSTATLYGRAQEGVAPSTTTSQVSFRADVAITSPSSVVNGTVSVQTSSGYSSGVVPVAVRINGC